MTLSTCREEVLSVVASLVGPRNDFTLTQVIDEMKRRGTRYAEGTVRTHVTSFMCVNAPASHSTTYGDFERLGRGHYRLVDSSVLATKEAVRQTLPSSPSEEVLSEVPAGNSKVQRDAEGVALEILSRQLELELRPERIHLPDGDRVEVDGVSHDPPVLVEVWTHQGRPKPAQRNKVLSDALKLQYVCSILQRDFRKVLCLTDVKAAAPFLGATWYAGALRQADVEIEVVELPDELRTAISKAQASQSWGRHGSELSS